MGVGRWLLRDTAAFTNPTRTFTGLLSGNVSGNMSTTGMTQATSIAGIDDSSVQIPASSLAFDFWFYNKNYGRDYNGGIYWATNNYISFGAASSAISFPASVVGVAIANADRRTTSFWYSGTLTSGGFSYINMLHFYQNFYNDNTPNAGQMQIRLLTNGVVQYIEVRCSSAPSNQGSFQISDGTSFQATTNSTYSSFASLNSGVSFVLASLIGNNNSWEFYPNYYVNV